MVMKGGENTAEVMKRIRSTHSYRCAYSGNTDCVHEFVKDGDDFRRCATWYQMWQCTKCSARVEEQLGSSRKSKVPEQMPLNQTYWTEERTEVKGC